MQVAVAVVGTMLAFHPTDRGPVQDFALTVRHIRPDIPESWLPKSLQVFMDGLRRRPILPAIRYGRWPELNNEKDY